MEDIQHNTTPFTKEYIFIIIFQLNSTLEKKTEEQKKEKRKKITLTENSINNLGSGGRATGKKVLKKSLR